MTMPVTVEPAAAAPFFPIPFSRLLRAEWRKTTGTRAARWLLAAVAVITISALQVPLLFPHDVPQTRASYLTWAALGLTRLLPIVLMLVMTAEWSQRTAMTTFTQEPRRACLCWLRNPEKPGIPHESSHVRRNRRQRCREPDRPS